MKEENETKVKEPTNEKELDIQITSQIQVKEIKNKTEVREVIQRKEQKKKNNRDKTERMENRTGRIYSSKEDQCFHSEELLQLNKAGMPDLFQMTNSQK
jgi:hypothetical protein